jgi:hypothetical protein
VTCVEAGESQGATAGALGVSQITANKWYLRLTQAAEPAMAARDASSRPTTSPTMLSRSKRRQIK